jgi:hypothetical protein
MTAGMHGICGILSKTWVEVEAVMANFDLERMYRYRFRAGSYIAGMKGRSMPILTQQLKLRTNSQYHGSCENICSFLC